MNGPISKGVSSALARAFSGRSAILKIVEELALGTRLVARLQKKPRTQESQGRVRAALLIYLNFVTICLVVCLFFCN